MPPYKNDYTDIKKDYADKPRNTMNTSISVIKLLISVTILSEKAMIINTFMVF